MKALSPWPAFDIAKPHPFFVTAAQVFNAWRRCGVPVPFAVAMVTQADMEAAFKPSAVGDQGTAFNIYQWHWSPRGAHIFGATGIDVRSETNPDKIVKAAWWEMMTVERRAYNAILAQKDSRAASIAACVYFEGAGAADAAARRGEEAERWSAWIGHNLAWVERQG